MILLAHEVWTTLSGDGRIGPFFVKTKEEKLVEMDIFNADDNGYVCFIPVLRGLNSKDISPGERATLAYLYYMIYEKKFLEEGDVIIIDAEAALCTSQVQQYLFDHGIHPFVLPSTLHQLLNPCDNSFHSIFKHRYYRLISNMNNGNIDVREKFHLAMQCFHGIPEESVSNMFLRCGLIPSGIEKRKIVSSLMCEGIAKLDRHDQHHKKCLLEFLKWVKFQNLRTLLCPVRISVADI